MDIQSVASKSANRYRGVLCRWIYRLKFPFETFREDILGDTSIFDYGFRKTSDNYLFDLTS